MATAAIAGVVASPLFAAATPAGTIISNTARVSLGTGADAIVQLSNRVDLRVDQVIDFSVNPAPTCAPLGNNVEAFGFVITNLGNGPERFIPGTPVATPPNGFTLTGVFADANRNGCYDPGIDPRIPAGDATSPVAPDGTITIFVVGTGDGQPRRITLPIRAATGSGRSGTTVFGGGAGGGDAVIGNSGGSVTGEFAANSSVVQASLVKSQSVRAPDGSTTPRRGAVITYRIEGRFAGVGTAMNAVITDAIPAGTSFVAGSLTLDDAPLSDAAGFAGQGVSVPLGNVAAPAVRSVAFQVRID